jgi:competence protein CoiA
MFSAQNRDGAIVQARDVTKEDDPFCCLGCTAAVCLKKGQRIAHHFAHLVTTTCQAGKGEGALHRRIKEAISEVLKMYPQVSYLKQERHVLKSVYPDISFRWQMHPGKYYWMVIEVQVSPISEKKGEGIWRRTQEYTARNVYVLWVLPWNEQLVNGAKYRPHPWERYLHALYMRRVYYWRPDQMLQPVIYIDLTVDGEEYHWYATKDKWIAAGSPCESVYKRLSFAPPIQITDLCTLTYNTWETDHISLPKRKLWTLKPGNGSASQGERGAR